MNSTKFCQILDGIFARCRELETCRPVDRPGLIRRLEKQVQRAKQNPADDYSDRLPQL